MITINLQHGVFHRLTFPLPYARVVEGYQASSGRIYWNRDLYVEKSADDTSTTVRARTEVGAEAVRRMRAACLDTERTAIMQPVGRSDGGQLLWMRSAA